MIRTVAKELAVTALLVAFVFIFVTLSIQNTVVVGNSMAPTISNAQRMFVNKMVYLRFDRDMVRKFMPWVKKSSDPKTYPFHSPRRGEIIVFYPPGDTGVEFIKRVIGVPGDKVSMRSGKVVLNGAILNEPYIKNNAFSSDNRDPVAVPPGTVYVLGDNRPNSEDSRAFGPVPQENIIGKAWFSFWPPSEWGFVHSISLDKVLKEANKAGTALVGSITLRPSGDMLSSAIVSQYLGR